MRAAPVIDAVRRAGGTLAIRGERIRLSAPQPLPDALVAEVRQHRAAILDLLRVGGHNAQRSWPVGLAAASATAEIHGWESGIQRLASMPTPHRYPIPAWQQLVADAACFVERWGKQAERLGWPTWQLFGCHRQAPWTRIQGKGLVLLLQGNEVAALTATEAAIRMRSGAHQTYRRKPADPLHPAERGLVWELVDEQS